MIILNIEPSDYSEQARETLQTLGEVREVECQDRDQLKTIITDADVLIVRLANLIDDDILQVAHALKVIVSATTGLNHIDLQAAARRGVTVLSLKGEVDFLSSITATAEHCWGLLLTLTRKLHSAAAHVEKSGWDRDQFQGRQLSGLTLGIVGYGRLGAIVAEYGNAFRMRILANDIRDLPHPAFVNMVPLSQLLTEADAVCLLPSLQPTSQKLIGKWELEQMKPSAILINVSRGEVIDECALMKALKSGTISAAALDVLDSEAEKKDGWLRDHQLVELARNSDKLLITPHIGGATTDSMRKTEVFMAEKLAAFLTKRQQQHARV